MAHVGQKACLGFICLRELSSRLLEVTNLLPELPCLLFHFLFCALMCLEKLRVPGVERIAERIYGGRDLVELIVRSGIGRSRMKGKRATLELGVEAAKIGGDVENAGDHQAMERCVEDERCGKHPQNRIEGAEEPQRECGAQHLAPVSVYTEAAKVTRRTFVLPAQAKGAGRLAIRRGLPRGGDHAVVIPDFQIGQRGLAGETGQLSLEHGKVVDPQRIGERLELTLADVVHERLEALFLLDIGDPQAGNRTHQHNYEPDRHEPPEDLSHDRVAARPAPPLLSVHRHGPWPRRRCERTFRPPSFPRVPP